MIKVTVWNEYQHEKTEEAVRQIYPNGLHAAIAEFLGKNEDITCRLACLDDPEHGLSQEVLDDTDVLIWWGHLAHHKVCDEVVERVYDRVLRGMGLIVLHSGHHSKIFRKLMGTSCNLKWREGARERLWCVNPGHPIAKGFRSILNWKKRRCTENFLIFPPPWRRFLSAGLTAARFSAADVLLNVGTDGFFISSPVMKEILLFIMKPFKK